MEVQIYPAIALIYENLYRQATLHASFKYSPNQRDRILICKFIVWLKQTYKPHQINESLLIQYFEFQFSRYSGVMTPKGKNNVMINWLLGQKAIKEWEKRNINKRYLVRWKINKDFQLRLITTFKKVKVNKLPDFLLKLNNYEEEEKQRFYNEPRGYLYCAQFTTLYNPVSEICKECDFKSQCKERLKINFPRVYAFRLEKNGRTTNNSR